jgi:Fe-S-cluster containining protein
LYRLHGRTEKGSKLENVNWLLFKHIFEAKRRGLLRLVPADRPTRLDCLADKCAMCCKTLGAPVLTDEEAARIPDELISRTKSGLFVKSHNCTCCILKKGLCSLYKDRPRGCHEYPWYNIDGKLYYDSGCPGIKHDIDGRPRADSIQSFTKFFPGASRLTLSLLRRLLISRRTADVPARIG